VPVVRLVVLRMIELADYRQGGSHAISRIGRTGFRHVGLLQLLNGTGSFQEQLFIYLDSNWQGVTNGPRPCKNVGIVLAVI